MSDRISIRVIDSNNYPQTFEVFMSYGLLNQLSVIAGSMERIPLLDTDPDLAATVIQVVLIPRSPSGKPTIDLENYDPPGLSQETAEQILDWVKEQLLSFFSRRVRATIKLLDANKEQLTAIGSSLAGMIPEPSNKLSS